MLLKKGSKGEEVKKLQEKLGLNPDGDFGNGTESKVIQWQSSNGLKPDGIVGDTTWNKMFEQQDSPAKLGEPGLNFNHNLLKGHIPDSVLQQIPETAIKFNITTKLRLAHFLSQCAHESGNFKAVSENLNYSADGLKKYLVNIFQVILMSLMLKILKKLLQGFMEVEWEMEKSQLKTDGNIGVEVISS